MIIPSVSFNSEVMRVLNTTLRISHESQTCVIQVARDTPNCRVPSVMVTLIPGSKSHPLESSAGNVEGASSMHTEVPD